TRPRVGDLEGIRDRPPSLPDVAARRRERPERRREPQVEVAVLTFARPAGRRAEVRVVVGEPGDRRRLVARPRLRVQAFRELCEPRGVAPAAVLELPRRFELLERELADGLEHPEARLAVRVCALAEEALLDERVEAVEQVLLAADRLCGLHAPPAHE